MRTRYLIDVCHRAFSLPGLVFLGPAPAVVPLSVFISPNGLVTVEGIARFNAVHFPMPDVHGQDGLEADQEEGEEEGEEEEEEEAVVVLT